MDRSETIVTRGHAFQPPSPAGATSTGRAPAGSPAVAGPPAADPDRSRRQERQRWDRRAPTWDDKGGQGLGAVVDAVLELSRPEPGEVAVDLGCGTGSLSLPLARRGCHVTAVDSSARMIDELRAKARRAGLDNITGVNDWMEEVRFPESSVDLVVSNYALHHLSDRAKARVVFRAARWLRPGGRIILGDMMFGRGATERDRKVIAAKALGMLRRGPAGWWRLAKNVGRYTFRLRERPMSMDRWVAISREAGLIDVRAVPVVAEAAVVVGVRTGR